MQPCSRASVRLYVCTSVRLCVYASVLPCGHEPPPDARLMARQVTISRHRTAPVHGDAAPPGQASSIPYKMSRESGQGPASGRPGRPGPLSAGIQHRHAHPDGPDIDPVHGPVACGSTSRVPPPLACTMPPCRHHRASRLPDDSFIHARAGSRDTLNKPSRRSHPRIGSIRSSAFAVKSPAIDHYRPQMSPSSAPRSEARPSTGLVQGIPGRPTGILASTREFHP